MNDDKSTPDYGYDPTVAEDVEFVAPEMLAILPLTATVDRQYLPPVGEQGTSQHPGSPGSCAAWASAYGLATFTGAKAGNYAPTTAAEQASPAYIYIQVLQVKVPPVSPDTCSSSQFSPYFKILAQGGTANLENAPYVPNCAKLWSDYASKDLPPDPAFTVSSVAAVKTDDLDSIKQIIFSGRALVYGTKLYTDWRAYAGDPVPYVGNKQIAYGQNGKPVGHCMLIIGYDDTKQALLIQNSQGTAWGSAGYVWMAYATFQALAQGQAFYVRT